MCSQQGPIFHRGGWKIKRGIRVRERDTGRGGEGPLVLRISSQRRYRSRSISVVYSRMKASRLVSTSFQRDCATIPGVSPYPHDPIVFSLRSPPFSSLNKDTPRAKHEPSSSLHKSNNILPFREIQPLFPPVEISLVVERSSQIEFPERA